MNKIFLVLLVVLMMISGVAANAGTYTFTPATADLSDLPHGNYFIWGIQWVLPTAETITGASFTYHSIDDSENDLNSKLYTHLLDSVVDTNGTSSPNYLQKVGYKTYTWQGSDVDGGGDQFAGQGALLGVFTENNLVVTKTYNVDPANFAWLTDGNFGFGIDPDCHYYNSGVDFTITTGPQNVPPVVPEPMSIMLGIIGLSSVASFKRWRR